MAYCRMKLVFFPFVANLFTSAVSNPLSKVNIKTTQVSVMKRCIYLTRRAYGIAAEGPQWMSGDICWYIVLSSP